MEETSMTMMTNSKETNKKDMYKVSEICTKIDRYEILFNHPAQREGDQWNLKMMSNLISDILQGNPIPDIIMAEQVKGDIRYMWNLDGKQRCTNIYNYVHDSFKISKGVRRNIISYQSINRDEDGNIIPDENGLPTYSNQEFDIVNKKFSQLPIELQDKITSYCIGVTLYLNCSDEDIVYHIERYNDGKPMTKSQKGTIRLGTEYATKVNKITSSDFFVEHGSYTNKETLNGTLTRVVSEAVMANNFMDDWKKNQEDMCEYLRNNATMDMFDEIEESIEELNEVVVDEVDELFNSKDSFVWFTVFSRYRKNGGNTQRFGEFLITMVNDLLDKEVDGCTFNELKANRSTKDKSVVLKKITHIESLLGEYIK